MSRVREAECTDGPPPTDEVTVANLTARRIEIAPHDRALPGLMVPPFGERVVDADLVSRYDCEPWVAQRLVRVADHLSEGERRPVRTEVYAHLSGYSFVFALIAAAIGLFTRDGRVLWFVASATLLLATIGFCFGTRWNPEAWRNMARSFNIFIGMLLAFGGSAAAIGLAGRTVPDRVIDLPGFDLAVVVLWLFLGLASVLPAALFIFFHRQKVRTLRTNFLRDVVRLDPNVQTTEDAESRYDVLIRDVFGSGTTGTSPGRRLPILACTGVITGLWVWTLVPGLNEATSIRDILLPRPDVVTFSFLGGYVFAINMLFRRYARADLGPKAYTHITVRMFAAIVAAGVLSFAPFARDAAGDPRPLMLLLAFFVGIVPETATAVIQDVLQQWKPVARAVPSLAEDHPLSRLKGISLYDRAQFLEAGIENVESLAHHDLVELMLWTRIPTARIVDFVDQAILYMHVRGPIDATQKEEDKAGGAMTFLARYGIRTATDLERAYSMAAGRSPEEGERLLAMLDSPGVAVHRLRVIIDAFEDDEWMVHVRNWRDMTSVAEPVRSVEEFVAIAARGSDPAGEPVRPANGSGPAPVAGNGAATSAEPRDVGRPAG